MAISNRQAAARVAVSTRRITEPDPDPGPDPEAAGLRDSHAGEDMTRRGLVGGQAGRQARGREDRVAQPETEAIRNISIRPTKGKTGDQDAMIRTTTLEVTGKMEKESRLDGRREGEGRQNGKLNTRHHFHLSSGLEGHGYKVGQ